MSTALNAANSMLIERARSIGRVKMYNESALRIVPMMQRMSKMNAHTVVISANIVGAA
jgi:hypothetical protein